MAGREPEETVRLPVSRQRWHAITFLHWAYDVEEIRRLLPEGVDVDTWDGKAWVSITPFLMKDFRMGGLPSVPRLSTFPETNLRTYVRGPDGKDGIWFLSLEAGSLPTVLGGFGVYGVPYRWADMSVELGETNRYRSRRRRPPGQASGPPVGHDITIRPGAPCEPASEQARWLCGRWRAYSVVGGRLASTPVEHQAWTLWDATVVELEQTLLAAAGLSQPADPPLVHYSPGVDVRLGPPRWLPREARCG
jgi:uncharacterized protein